MLSQVSNRLVEIENVKVLRMVGFGFSGTSVGLSVVSAQMSCVSLSVPLSELLSVFVFLLSSVWGTVTLSVSVMHVTYIFFSQNLSFCTEMMLMPTSLF